MIARLSADPEAPSASSFEWFDLAWPWIGLGFAVVLGIPVLLAAGVLMHAVLAGSVILFLRGGIPEWVLLAAQPIAIAAGYPMVAASDRRLRVGASAQ